VAGVVAEQRFAAAGLYCGWEVGEGTRGFTIAGVFTHSPLPSEPVNQGRARPNRSLSAGSRKMRISGSIRSGSIMIFGPPKNLA